ncbi:MAG: hypothetical protein ACJ8G1_11250, partial [Vitreoscilla sp.]
AMYGGSTRYHKTPSPDGTGYCGNSDGGTQVGWNIKWVDVAAGATSRGAGAPADACATGSSAGRGGVLAGAVIHHSAAVQTADTGRTTRQRIVMAVSPRYWA